MSVCGNLHRCSWFIAIALFLDLKLCCHGTTVANYDFYENLNCPGGDIFADFKNSPAECAAECDSRPTCVAFAYEGATPYCYVKEVCDSNGLSALSGWDTYIKNGNTSDLTTDLPTTVIIISTTSKAASTTSTTTSSSTTTAAITSNTASSYSTNATISTAKNSSAVSFQWLSYSIDYNDVTEAPHAVSIGSSMLILLIAFILFFVFLDINNYRKSLKYSFRNCRHFYQTRILCKKKQTGRTQDKLESQVSSSSSAKCRSDVGHNLQVVSLDEEHSETFSLEIGGERTLSVSSGTSSRGGITDRKSLLKSVQQKNVWKKQ